MSKWFTLVYAVFEFQYNPEDKMPEELQLFRSCIITLISIRNTLEIGPHVDKLSAEVLASMLSDLGRISRRLRQLSFAKKEPKLQLFKDCLSAILLGAASELGSGIPFRESYEKYKKNSDEKKNALQECLKACYGCSGILDRVLSDPRHLPHLKRFGID